MRLQISKTKNAASLYIVKSTYDRSGKRSNKIVEKLGTLAELSKIHDDPIAWGKARAEELTRLEKEGNHHLNITFDPNERLKKDKQRFFNCGYLYLQRIYYESGLDKICRNISKHYQFEYDLNEILSRLVYGRILFPGSKLSTTEEAKNLIEQPKFALHDVYRALSVLAEESEFIQGELYTSSLKVIERNSDVLYYDCTNFYFEIEQAKGICQYGVSKENRPNPIVEMGLFMDGNGIPLAVGIYPGNTNEQITMQPLEEQILRDFKNGRIIVCTDAGLSSKSNRRFNSTLNKNFITVQSVKNLKEYQKKWLFDPDGWYFETEIKGKKQRFKINLDNFLADENNCAKYYDTVFFKDAWMKDDGIEQRFIATFSLKYREYLRNIRNNQIERAKKMIQNNSSHKRQNDPKRFIKDIAVTDNGECAEKKVFCLDKEQIATDEQYDGYYCVATNLEESAAQIIQINKGRWKIEESFRIMKSELKSRPVFLSRDDRIKAHFLTCFLALYVYRILEKKLDEKFTTREIIQTLQNMNMLEIPREGYVPTFTASPVTDAIQSAFNLFTDHQITTLSDMRKIISVSKKS